VKARWLDLVIAGVVAALVSIPVRGAGDSLTAARAMYAAAEYEDALAALNRLQETADRPLEEKRAIAPTASLRSAVPPTPRRRSLWS